MLIPIFSRRLLAVAVAGCAAVSTHTEDWTRFRGENGRGVAATANVPETWNETENIRWKVDLPGPGSSSPIVLGDRVYLTCYTGYGVDNENPGEPESLERHLLCHDLKSGQELWRTTIKSTEAEDAWEGFIRDHGFASSTPATDGKRIYVQCGKTGLAAFDLEGKQLWMQPLGKLSDPAKWGDGSSPVLFENLVIANAGITGHMVIALDAETGKEVWRIEDEKFTNSWSTPILVKTADRTELVCSSPGKVFGVDPKTGKQLWFAVSPVSETVCSSPMEHDGVVFVMGGRAGNAVAVKCGGDGDVTATHIVWKGILRSGIGTPVVVDGRMYWTSSGMAMCANCSDGKEVFKSRINYNSGEAAPAEGEAPRSRGPRGDYASPLVIGKRILFLNRAGQAHWIEAGETYVPVGVNAIQGDEGPFNATPAVTDDSLLIRSNARLYCIGAK